MIKSSELVIKKYEIQYLDLKTSIENVSIDRTFSEFFNECLDFNKTNDMKFHISYSPGNRISVVKLFLKVIHSNKKQKNTELEVDLFISPYRNCIIDKHLNGFKILLIFFCEFKSIEDYEKETIPQSLQFSFKSKKNFSLRICKIRVYQFQDECGTPDSPLHALRRSRGKSIEYYLKSRHKKYRMIGNNTINCLLEGQWDREPPIIEPIQCNIDEIRKYSWNYKKFDLKNFEFLNEIEVAVIDSKIVFECNYENSTKIRVLTCNENSSWIGDDFKCKIILQ